MKKKVHAVRKTTINFLGEATKSEPSMSICIGYSGPSGTFGTTKFSSVVDMAGRGIKVDYEKKDGTAGSYSISVVPMIEAIFKQDAKAAKTVANAVRERVARLIDGPKGESK